MVISIKERHRSKHCRPAATYTIKTGCRDGPAHEIIPVKDSRGSEKSTSSIIVGRRNVVVVVVVVAVVVVAAVVVVCWCIQVQATGRVCFRTDLLRHGRRGIGEAVHLAG